MSYFPEPYTPSQNKIKGELDLSSYGRKSYIKGAKGIDTSKVPKEVDLANFKSNIDKLNIDQLKTTPVDSRKVVENDIMNYIMNWLKTLMLFRMLMF